VKRLLYITLLILICSCNTNKKDYIFSDEDCVIFKEDPNEKDESFEPTISEVKEVETAFRDYLDIIRQDTINYALRQQNVPKSEKLKIYKRRYFGRVNTEGEKVIKAEFIFVTYLTSKERKKEQWKEINYLENKESMCWFSFQYNLERKVIYGL
jgi:hypothetical protein